MSNDIEYPEVYKVIGAPGTGKTTRVVGNPDLGLDGLFIENGEEYSLDEQMLVTYTKAGTEEAADRLEQMLDVPKYKIDERVTTIHSQCYSTLGVDRDQVVGYWDKKQFCGRYGLDFSGDDDEDDIMSGDMAEGDALFQIYGWLQSNLKKIEDWQDCPVEYPGTEDVENLLNAWVDYKDEKDLIGFGDMIQKTVEMGYDQVSNLGWGVLFPDDSTTYMEMFEKARWDSSRDPEVIRGKGAFIDTKVLYVDEVQDLTPLQWAWYLLQKLAVEKVYIGGDDDQTIYGWAGANPNFMLDEEGDFEVLDKTYRIPKNIWEKCDGVIQQVDKRQEKELEPEGDGGEVVTYRSPAPRQLMQHLKEGECMILFRARYQIDEFRDHLHNFGIPYRNMSTFDTWGDDIVKLRDALAKIENGDDKIKGDELNALMEYAEDHMISSGHGVSEKEKVLGQFGGIESGRVEEIFDLSGGLSPDEFTMSKYLNSTDEINYYEKEAIRGNIQAGNEHMDPDRVRIGTIHSSKGKEAPTVMLATDSTKTILENMADELDEPMAGMGANTPITDAERRVYYVGMTRASEELILAQGAVTPDCCIDLDALLDEDASAEQWESGRGANRAGF